MSEKCSREGERHREGVETGFGEEGRKQVNFESAGKTTE